METGRGAALALAGACAAGTVAAFRARVNIPAAAMPLLLALAWQAMALGWSPVPEPGLVWLVERAAGLVSAVALGSWLITRPDTFAPAALAVAGAGILALTCLTQIGDLGRLLWVNREAPFGNVNFNVGAAMPLVAIGLARFLHGGGRRWWLYALVAAGLAGLLAGGALGGDPCRAVWLAGLTALAAGLMLRLPRIWHGPVLLAGGGLLVCLWLVAIAGFFDPGRLGAGSAQRIHIWHATLESLAGPAALIGHGPAAVIAVLPDQPSFAAAWLTVPSYVAHAHAEPLQVLSDGGLVLAGLLAWAVYLTIRPLWLRRNEPVAGALIVAWCTCGSLALVESHLSQPGGVLTLALLAGVSWSLAPPWRLQATSAPWLFAGGCTLALCVMLAREMVDGGGPVGIEARSERRMGSTAAADLEELDFLRRRLGPLDNIDVRRARALGRLDRLAEADDALAAHLVRLPGDAEALVLARRRVATGTASAALTAAHDPARQCARILLGQVQRNPTNGTQLDRLATELSRPADGGPVPAP